MKLYGTSIRVNKSKLFNDVDELINSVTYVSKSNNDKYIVCKQFENHCEILLVDESQEKFGNNFQVFEFVNSNDANNKFKELCMSDVYERIHD